MSVPVTESLLLLQWPVSCLVMSRGMMVLLACATYDAYVAGDLHKIAANDRTKVCTG